MSFQDEGYLHLKSFFNAEEIAKLQSMQDEIFPSYKTGLTNYGVPARDNKYYREVFYDKKKEIRYDGWPLKHRIFRGQGSPQLSETPNILYGKRASKTFINLPISYDEYIFNPELLDIIKSCLGSNDLFFSLASANRVFPHYQGESGLFHIDTYGFRGSNNEFTDDYLINVIIYINGTDKGRSGTLFLPNSHKNYRNINKRVAKALNKNSDQNTIHQREAFFELFSDEEIKNIQKVDASAGDIFIFRSDLFHCIPKNFSDNLHRDVIIINFSCKEKFFKTYSKKESQIIKKRLSKQDQPIFFSKYSVRTFKSVKNHLSSLKKKSKIIIQNSKKIYLNNFFKFSKKKDLKNLEIMNLGAGPSFCQRDIISLDYNDDYKKIGIRVKTLADINFDLSKKERIPFNDNSFKAIYTSHCMEHLTTNQAKHIFKESHRLLKKGGIFRIVVPSIKLYLEKYDQKNLSFFNWIRNKSVYRHDSWLRFIVREFAGAVVDDFEDYELIDKYKKYDHEEFINYFNELSNSEKNNSRNIPDIHKSGWTTKLIIKTLKNQGFSDVYISKRHKSRFKKFQNEFIFDNTRPEISLYIEGIK